MVQRTRPSFGKAFEARGDYARAAQAYQAEGLEEDVRRVHSTIKVLEVTQKLEINGFLARAVDLLLDNGLSREAKALVDRTKEAECRKCSGCYQPGT